MKEIKVSANEGPCPFPRGDNNKIIKYIKEFEKSSYPKLLRQFQPSLAQNIFGWGERDSSLFKLRTNNSQKVDNGFFFF